MADTPLDILTYSSGTTLGLCEKKYQWRYEKRLRPAAFIDADPLEVGNAFHAGSGAYLDNGLEAGIEAVTVWREKQAAFGEDGNRKLDERAAKAKAMLIVSSIKWPREKAEDGLTEDVVTLPIRNPDTNGTSRTFTFKGKLDGLHAGRLIDWKGVPDPDDFIRGKKIGYQVELYALAMLEKGITVDCAEFRLVTRPSIKFCGKDADAESYQIRCQEWLEDDASRLVTHEVWINQARLDEARRWLWSISQRVIENRRTGRWLMNELACKTFNRECEYVGLCLCEANGGDAADLIGSGFREGPARS